MKFIHLTDTHLVARGDLLHGMDPASSLERCMHSIATQHADAAFCVLTGDVADAGNPEAYRAVHEILARAPMPVHVIPGNHDDRDAFVTAFTHAPRDEHGFVQHAFRHEGSTFVLLDTLEPARGSGGAFCERRARWLTQRLNEAGSDPVYLFMHHPPFHIGVPALDRIAVMDPGPFTRALEGRDNIRHLFFGHVHRPVSGQWRGISFSTLYGTNHQTRFDTSETDYLAYTAEPPAYAVVLADRDTLVVHNVLFEEDDADIRDGRPG